MRGWTVALLLLLVACAGADGDRVRGSVTAGKSTVEFEGTVVAGGLSGTYEAVSLGLCTGDAGTLDLAR